MKKWATGLLAISLVLAMTACGKDKEATGANKDNSSSTSGQIATTTSEELPTLEQLLTKSAAAAKDMKSVSLEMDMTQDMTMTQGEEVQQQATKMNIISDFILEPLQVSQNIKMTMGDQINTEVTQYITEQGVFVQVDGAWSKQPDELREQMIAQMKASANPENQLEQFKKMANDTKITVDGDEYVLTAEVSGDGVKELARELMSQAGGNTGDTDAMLDQMNIKNIKVASAVNKDTYLTTKSNVQMVMEMEQEGMKLLIDMDMKTTFSKYNEVSEIKVPQEALDSAK